MEVYEQPRCFSWSPSKATLAIGTGRNVVLYTVPKNLKSKLDKCDGYGGYFYKNRLKLKAPGSKEEKIDAKNTCAKHSQDVLSVAWRSEKEFVTCSEDRNSYVWTDVGKKEWNTQMVLLRFSHGALVCKNNPKAFSGKPNDFAVGGAKTATAVLSYETGNKWWVSKHVKGHKSAVLDLDWHPTGKMLATASTDSKCIIYDIAIKAGKTINKLKATSAKEYDCGCWASGVAWSPDGTKVAVVCMDSTLHIVSLNGDPVVISSSELPFTCVTWLNDDLLAACGFGSIPCIFSASKGTMIKKLVASATAKKQQSNVASARAMFQTRATKGTVSKTASSSKPKGLQENGAPIMAISKFDGMIFTTLNQIGALEFWNAKSCA